MANNGQLLQKTEEISMPIVVTLEEAYRGVSHLMVFGRYRLCHACHGTINPPPFCNTCDGRRVMPEQRTLNVTIGRGVESGQLITFENEGSQEPNKSIGDVVFVVDILPHHVFGRDGDDLTMRVTLELVEALCGFSKVVTTIDGRSIPIRKVKGEVVPPNGIIRIENEGMPIHHIPEERGSLIIKFEVNMQKVNHRRIGLWEECLPRGEPLDIPLTAEERNMVDFRERRFDNTPDEC